MRLARNREFSDAYQGKFFEEQEIRIKFVSVHCSHACFAPGERDLFSLAFLQSEEEQIFVTVDIADASAPSDASPSEEERVP
jgi:hypothetical protein